ncbi:MAG: tRNA (adenosine(37)-N6)-threonylcarbamoyltransferase complex ATPase subunit type 1 TsaE [Chitinivibrionales bacterium]|nr:tRNA (adenosine(37)-N6)-threonylcarbamoyltransferase complex ATPase subunit type 1 TsaE [Chitinivibrionales bacterium]MBD3396838.1 tRNA (adenosine(37)-N6)-threonylcarbamoyltransferase complex ATPase subunit type 1 TsaE [Chitinivibrionales bacterium]
MSGMRCLFRSPRGSSCRRLRRKRSGLSSRRTITSFSTISSRTTRSNTPTPSSTAAFPCRRSLCRLPCSRPGSRRCRIMEIRSQSVGETRAVGARMAAQASAGETYGLVGPLGAGKTEFVRGFVAALNPVAAVRSPTFTLVNTYETHAFPVHHFDFYRLGDPDELGEIGFWEYVGADGVCLIEWADMFVEALPGNIQMIGFRDEGEGKRVLEIDRPDDTPSASQTI